MAERETFPFRQRLPSVGELAKPQALTEGVHTPLYDRIMNLYKHFCKGLDSRAKTVIMVLALMNKEC